MLRNRSQHFRQRRGLALLLRAVQVFTVNWPKSVSVGSNSLGTLVLNDVHLSQQIPFFQLRPRKTTKSFSPTSSQPTCWAFQAGKTCTGCKFEHICFKYGSGHPASQCPSHKGKSKTALASEQADRVKQQTNNSGKSA